MTIIEIKDRTEILINKLLEVWEDSVKATHLFLSSEEIEKIKKSIYKNIDWIKYDNEYSINDRKSIKAEALRYLNFIEIILQKQ